MANLTPANALLLALLAAAVVVVTVWLAARAVFGAADTALRWRRVRR